MESSRIFHSKSKIKSTFSKSINTKTMQIRNDIFENNVKSLFNFFLLENRLKSLYSVLVPSRNSHFEIT
jgi:hypothetical protein